MASENWVDGSGVTQPQLRNATDIDISITPFTNTLPIRRLNLWRDQSQEIIAVYREIECDTHRLVTDYPELFRRVF